MEKVVGMDLPNVREDKILSFVNMTNLCIHREMNNWHSNRG